MPKNRTCQMCDVKKPISEFNVSTRFKDGRIYYKKICKSCKPPKEELGETPFPYPFETKPSKKKYYKKDVLKVVDVNGNENYIPVNVDRWAIYFTPEGTTVTQDDEIIFSGGSMKYYRIYKEM